MIAQGSDGPTQRRSDTEDPIRRPARGVALGVLHTTPAILLAMFAFAASVRGQATTTPAPAAVAPPRTIGKWLVDLGRDYPLTPQASLSNADAELTLAFMQAASRLEPGLAEAYRWQHDLFWALNREDQATEALGRYVKLEPDDYCAHILWIAAKTDALQTLDKRVEFWRAQLQDSALPGEVASDLRRRMAEYYYNRGEGEAAKKEIAEAIKAFPENLAAQKLRVDMTSTPEDIAPRLALALDMVRLSPAQMTLAWDVAKLLDEASLPREAQPWYQHAVAMFQRTNPGQTVPGDFLLDMAASQIDAGLLDAAQILCNQVIQTEGDSPLPRTLLARIAKLRSRGVATTRPGAASSRPQSSAGEKADEAKTQLGMARSQYEAAWSKVKDRPDPDLAAEIAWFYCIDDPNPDRAYELATAAMKAATPSRLARRAFGYAAAQKGQYAEAQKVLAPLAPSDPWAAVAFAIVKEKSGDTKAAVELLTGVAKQHRTGQLFQEATARLAALNAMIPPPPSNERIKELLAHFDEAVLLFPTDPKKFLELTITPLMPASGELLPGDPVWCRFVLRNISPFSITLGDDLMVSPTILVLARSTGDRVREYGPLLRVAMNRQQVLRPGRSISVTQTIDVGPLRTTLIATPQITQTIDITAILSPVFVPEQQRWAARPGGFAINPVRLERKGLLPSQPGPHGLLETLNVARSGDVTQRAAALDRLMMWLAEQEHLRAGRLNYTSQPVSVAALRSGVQERFADPAWQVRTHLAEALRWVTLDKDLAQAASGMLSDLDWPVRMLAVRLFADHQKEKFDKVAAYYAQSDPDALVRAVATAVRERWAATTQPAATQPATTTPAGP